jgi:cellulose synthase/poly-beta-1,6-N-acetylglucosamine synthase-like glycosyltransferase
LSDPETFARRLLRLGSEASATWREGGLAALHAWRVRKAREWRVARFESCRKEREEREYATWVHEHDTFGPAQEAELRSHPLARTPRISVLVPVHETPERWLRRAIESVLGQVYPVWELCLADDGSRAPHVRAILDGYARQDPRIKVVFREKNGHIAAASNSALEIATGELVALLDHDDEIRPHALWSIAEELERHPDADLVFTDEDKIDADGRRFAPVRKGEWNPDLMLATNAIGHLGVYRRELVRSVGGFREGLEGSQDYDLALRCIAASAPGRIRHVPRVLYHFRAIPGSSALESSAKPYMAHAALRAIKEHLAEHEPGARAEPDSGPRLFRVRFPLGDPPPLVSIVTRAERVATSYPRFEVVPEASAAKGEVLCFLDPSLRPWTRDWLEEMVSHARRAPIGAVGAKIVDRSGWIVHGARVSGASGAAADHFRGLPYESEGPASRAAFFQDALAVSGRCLVLRRAVLEALGGRLDQDDLTTGRRLHDLGLRVLWTPFALLGEG